jgi:hypothetical protein
MNINLEELTQEVKMIKGLAKDAGSEGQALLQKAKKAETLLDKAKIANAKGDSNKELELVSRILTLIH